jgi:uncharacterized protein (DUF4213/DUF364 family)
MAGDTANATASDAGTILGETIAAASAILGPDFAALRVERAVIGLRFTGVKLASGHAGACVTPLGAIERTMCAPRGSPASPGGLPGGRIAGRPAADLVTAAPCGDAIGRALGIAALNALAEACWVRRPAPGVTLARDRDAFAATTLRPADRIVVVGAFTPFLRALKEAGRRCVVLEADPARLAVDDAAVYRPASEAAEIVPQADVLLITGATLVNGTLDRLLALADPAARITILGPSVGMLPDAFLGRGVAILGGVRITAPDAFLDLVAEGASGRALFGRACEKIVLARV